ncbi:MAG: choice-of-anchor Q domain-containing protein [Rhodanobacteraceae bacterium]
MSAALGSCLALLPGGDLHAGTTIVVDNCDDSGGGSLRDAVASAASGDTVDLTALSCSTISLSSGAIEIAQASLTIEGPGTALVLDAGYSDRILHHSGTGTLFVSGLTLREGKYISDTNSKGGCVFSAGNVSLSNTLVTKCSVTGQDLAVALGGAIFTQGNLAVVSSRITGNRAQGAAEVNSSSNGGAALVVGDLTVKYSTFDHNEALPTVGRNSGAGAVETFGSATIIGSTFSDNYALFFGALSLEGADTNDGLIMDSTFSHNIAQRTSAIYTQFPLRILNSTIALNLAGSHGAVYSQDSSLEFQSTIIAGNESSGATADDLNGTANTPPVTGANNLITSSDIPLPPDTITDCPRLAQLSNYGGTTQTHALLDDSPAIDAGNNVDNLAEDQRGQPREFGPATDIGAYEWDGPVEFMFHSGFEPTCDN